MNNIPVVNSCYPNKGNVPSLDELRMTLQNCGSSLTASDFKRLIDFLEGVDASRFGTFMGIAELSTNPANDNRVLDGVYGWYVAKDVGTYSHFKNSSTTFIEVSESEKEGKIVFFYYNRCTKLWSKQTYTVTDVYNKSNYIFNVFPSNITVPFAHNSVIGQGGTITSIVVESIYKNELSAYLSENNLPWWIKYRGVKELPNGKVQHDFFICENKGKRRCAQLQFVQLGSNNIEFTEICQDSNNLWMYAFDIKGERTYIDNLQYSDAVVKAYKQNSYKLSDYIGWNKESSEPSWYSVKKVGEYVIAAVEENNTGVNREFGIDFKQDESGKIDTLLLRQSSCPNPDKYVFLINEKLEETVKFSTSSECTVQPITSTKNDFAHSYKILSSVPDWVHLELFGEYVKICVDKNPLTDDRNALVLFEQQDSKKVVLLNILQSSDCRFEPFNKPIYKIIHSRSGCSKCKDSFVVSPYPFENIYYVVTKLDINPNSPTYNKEITEWISEKDCLCTNTNPYFESTGIIDCSESPLQYVLDSYGDYSYILYKDINPFSPTYGKEVWNRNPVGDGNCIKPLPFKWVGGDYECEMVDDTPNYDGSGVKGCSSSSSQYLGDDGIYGWKQVTDTNQHSNTYNQDIWIRDSSYDGVCNPPHSPDVNPSGCKKCSDVRVQVGAGGTGVLTNWTGNVGGNYTLSPSTGCITCPNISSTDLSTTFDISVSYTVTDPENQGWKVTVNGSTVESGTGNSSGSVSFTAHVGYSYTKFSDGYFYVCR